MRTDEPTSSEIANATFILSDDDYRAIGTAVACLSWLETILGNAILASEIGIETALSESKHSKKFQSLAKKSFFHRIKAIGQCIEQKGIAKKTAETFERNLTAVLEWRNFLCHASFKKLPDGRVHGIFWDRASFDENSAPIVRTFRAAELFQVAQTATELSEWLFDEFGTLSMTSDKFID